MKLRRDSQLAEFCDRWVDCLPNDLCQLFWAFVGSAVICAVATALAAFTLILGPVSWYFIIAYGYVNHWLVAPAAVFLIVTIGLGLTLLIKWAVTRGGNPVPPIVREAYRGVKDRYCPLIEWTAE